MFLLRLEAGDYIVTSILIEVTDYKVWALAGTLSFRVVQNEMITYTQTKKGMSYYYDKRQVMSNGVDTLPLPI